MNGYPNYEVQMNEKLALQAIFDDKFEEVQFPWKVAHPPQFKISITAGFASAELLFKFSTEYPNELPSITVINKHGLSPQTANALRDKLIEHGQTLVGREMVYDLVEFAKQFLHAKPAAVAQKMTFSELEPASRSPTPPSLSVETTVAELQAADFEKNVLHALAMKESKMAASRKSSKSKALALKTVYLNAPFYVREMLKDIENPIASITLSRVIDPRGNPSVYVGKTEKCDQDFYVEEFSCSPLVTAHSLSQIETGLMQVCPLRHPNIVTVFGYKIAENFVYVISDFIKGESLEYIVEKSGGMNPTIALKYLQKILSGVRFLHLNNLAHKNLTLSHVRVEDGPKLSIKLRGCNYYLDCKCLSKASNTAKFITKKDDVFACGLLYLSCVFGKQVNENNLESMLQTLPNEISAFISQFFINPPTDRPEIEELYDDDIFTDSFPGRFVDFPFTLSRIESPKSVKSFLMDSFQSESRYLKDFDELDFLGRGGYGQVVKARNKLDNQIYAVKKILLNPDNAEENKKILREVTALSKFHHQYITRYYQAWIENCSDSAMLDIFRRISEDELISVKLPKQNLVANILFNINEDEDLDANNSFDQESSTSGYQILYIQMEFCPKMTLRDVIDDGTLTVDESWRLFRQILEALTHIHGNGMIHRDLKPGNIFLDSEGNVKIGDFGLVSDISVDESMIASSFPKSPSPLNPKNDGIAQLRGLRDSNNSKSSSIIDIEHGKNRASSSSHDSNKWSKKGLTHGMGTPFYTSPEAMLLHGKYNYKIDMYSLGIIFFEMIYPIKTGMERSIILKGLRENPPVFPKDFDVEKYENQYALIKNLLLHDPENRMSAEELLKSSLLPSSIVGQDLLSESSLATIFDPTSALHHRVVKEFFLDENIVRQFNIVNDFTFDYNCGIITPENQNFDFYSMQICQLKKICQRIFELFSVQELEIPALLPWNPAIQMRPDLVKFMDSFGNIVVLPFDLTHQFARFLGHTSQVVKLKSYFISNVYRLNLTGGQPKHFLQCSLQMVSSQPQLFHDAMLLKIAHFLFQSLPLHQGNVELHLNHASFGKFILQSLSLLNDKATSSGNGLLEFFGTHCFGNLTAKLKNMLTVEFGLNGKQIDFLNSLFLLRAEFTDKLLGRLSSLLAINNLQATEFVELKAFFQCTTQVIEMSDWKIIFNPLLHLQDHCGVVYAVQKNAPKKRSDCICTGGKINHLLKEYNRGKQEYCGSSMTFFLTKIAFNCNMINDPQTTPHWNIFVTSLKECNIIDRFRVATLLWKAGFICELSEENELNNHQIGQYLTKHNVLVLVVKSSKTKDQIQLELKVKILDKKIEFACNCSNIVTRLTEYLDTDKKDSAASTNENIFLVLSSNKKQISSQVIERIKNQVKSLGISLTNVNLIIYDYVRDIRFKNESQFIEDDDFGKKVKQILRVIWERRDENGSVMFYSTRDECFDIWSFSQISSLF